jgi:hypothetical protein
MEDTLFLVLFWSGPIGLGFFFLCLGTFIYLLSKADAVKKAASSKEKEKG